MQLSQIDAQLIADDCKGLVVDSSLKIGGQKHVWRCAFKGRAYVLKALVAEEPTFRRVKRELEIMRVCKSPYLPKLGPLRLSELQIKGGEKVLYFLEEYIDGLPVGSVYKPMPCKDVIHLGLCVVEALRILTHKGYLHRDIKPMNIIQKNSTHYVLIDAGLALARDGEAITELGSVVGTRAYISPDQLQIQPNLLDVRADMFLLGITMYECATGQHPFLNDALPRGDVVHTILSSECLPLQNFNAEVPDRLANVILKLLQKKRENRFGKLEDLKKSLKSLL